jgi:hypothetical protein
MPKHSIFSRRVAKPPTPKIHPIWRGIGCVFMIVIPGIAFVASNLIIENSQKIPWLAIPDEMVIKGIFDPLLLVKVIYTAVISVIIFFLISLITFFLNLILNPKRKGPFDL